MTPSRFNARSYGAGCALVILSGLILSLGVLCIRGAASLDAWSYLMWRGVGFGGVLAIVGLWRHGPALLTQICSMGGYAWIAAVAMVISQVGFVSAVQTTTVAEVFLLFSLAPLMTAVIARPILGERIGLLGGLAIVMALGGVLLMSELTSTDATASAAAWTGRILALLGAFTFALYSLMIRGSRRQDIDPLLVACGALTFLVSLGVLLWRGTPLISEPKAMALAFMHGALVLSLGLVLFSRGSGVVPAATLMMLAQTETVAAPVWAWLFFNETTTLAVIAGGALILTGVMLQAVDGARGSASRVAHQST